MGISKITTGNFHVYSNNHANQDSEIDYNSTIEIDSRSYPHCFYKNFRVVLTTEQVFSVTVFFNKLELKTMFQSSQLLPLWFLIMVQYSYYYLDKEFT